MAGIMKNKKSRYHGTTIVEAAIIFPLLLLITLGIIEYSWLFLKAQQVTNATRQGARVAIRTDATNAEVLDAIDWMMTTAGMAASGYTVGLDPPDVSSRLRGETLDVQITVPCASIALIDVPFLPTPTSLRAVVTMAKEGP